MTDLISRLRSLSRPGGGGTIGNEAADEIEKLRAELANVNNEFGSQTADWPDAWQRVADLKQLANDRWRENERLRTVLQRIAEFPRQHNGELSIEGAGTGTRSPEGADMTPEQRAAAERLAEGPRTSGELWGRAVIALLRELAAEPVQEPVAAELPAPQLLVESAQGFVEGWTRSQVQSAINLALLKRRYAAPQQPMRCPKDGGECGAGGYCRPEPVQRKPSIEPFVVRHYAFDERSSIKGNGFDGLAIGEDREEAECFIKFVNAAIKGEPT